MDIVLEVVDTFVGDKLYAALLPAQAAPYDFPYTAANATAQPLSTWQYKPSTHWLYLEPSEAAYMSAWSRDNIVRQFISLFLVVWIFGLLNYFVSATLSYIFIFDKKTFDHPKFLKNQIRLEMKPANQAITNHQTSALFCNDWESAVKSSQTASARIIYCSNLKKGAQNWTWKHQNCYPSTSITL